MEDRLSIQAKSDDVCDRELANLMQVLEKAEAERQALFGELGELLYERTKDDESFFLVNPGLYLAIARAEETRALCMRHLDELRAGAQST